MQLGRTWGHLLVAALIWLIVPWACTTGSEGESEQALSAHDRQLIPLRNEDPRPPGDVRHLQNCAEEAFPDPWRGPWDSVSNKQLAREATPTHRTTDQVVAVGDSVTLGARMQYDEGPLSEEWVRLFIGSCNGWSQVGVRKTDEEGNIVFRLDERLPSGVYAAVFQATGDATTVRAQIWVLPREAEVVAVDLRGAAFDADNGEPVVAAPALTGWHSRDGRVVVYVDHVYDDSQWSFKSDEWHKRLRSEGFAVGPVVDLGLDLSTDDGPAAPPDGWGEAAEQPRLMTGISTPISTLYATEADVAMKLDDVGTQVSETVYRRQYCEPGDDGEPRTGWSSLVTELSDEEEDEGDDPG